MFDSGFGVQRIHTSGAQIQVYYSLDSDLSPQASRSDTKVVQIQTDQISQKSKKPALLLLHGYPQTHAMWSALAPQLAQHFFVVCPDLRGYGDSSKPAGLPDHSNYSKRAMAQDMVEVSDADLAVVTGQAGLNIDPAKIIAGLNQINSFATIIKPILPKQGQQVVSLIGVAANTAPVINNLVNGGKLTAADISLLLKNGLTAGVAIGQLTSGL